MIDGFLVINKDREYLRNNGSVWINREGVCLKDVFFDFDGIAKVFEGCGEWMHKPYWLVIARLDSETDEVEKVEC